MLWQYKGLFWGNTRKAVEEVKAAEEVKAVTVVELQAELELVKLIQLTHPVEFMEVVEVVMEGGVTMMRSYHNLDSTILILVAESLR